MMINTDGIIIRMSCENISVLSRITSGVKLMRLNEEDTVVSVAKVRETSAKNADEDEEEEDPDREEDSSEETEEDDGLNGIGEDSEDS